uniref:hypothetical protein n=1 Tax=Paractinoplanes polyasparticus TaxID=2856853 RepID=UPI001C861817|nr:hypothetical protein [Actinoplanes polyasparticus]
MTNAEPPDPDHADRPGELPSDSKDHRPVAGPAPTCSGNDPRAHPALSTAERISGNRPARF